MKQIVLFFLAAYRVVLSPFLHAATGTVHACRYNVTCSEYAVQAIQKHGALRGSLLALRRLSSCHPFAKAASDQV